MKRPDKLYCTTIKIWTDYDPKQMDIDDLAREAMSGDGFCSLQGTECISDPNKFPSTEFFGET